MNHNYYAEFDDIRLRPLTEYDIELLRKWRNHQESTRFLRKIDHITKDMQKEWFENYQKNPNEIIFAIEETQDLHRLIGSLSLYDIDWKRLICSIGKIQIGDNAAHGRGAGRKALVMSMKVGFRFLSLKKITGSVHRENIPAHRNDMKVGFKIAGEQSSEVGGIEDLIEITEEDIIKANSYYYKIKSYIANLSHKSIYVGAEGYFSKTITETDIYIFSGITGDFNPIHVNKIEAQKSIFGECVAHGHLTSALFSTVIGMKMPGPGTICLSQSSQFLKPVYFNDTITACVWVNKIIEKNRALLKMAAYNQLDQQVISGEALVLLPKKTCVYDKIAGGGGTLQN